MTTMFDHTKSSATAAGGGNNHHQMMAMTAAAVPHKEENNKDKAVVDDDNDNVAAPPAGATALLQEICPSLSTEEAANVVNQALALLCVCVTSFIQLWQVESLCWNCGCEIVG